MKTTVENLAKTKVKLTVEVPAEELKPAMDKAYKEIGQQVNVPGFRKGHVPPQIIDRRIGRAYVVEQAINSKLSDFYGQALSEAEVQPLAQPAIEVTDIPTGEGEDQQLVFTAEVEIMPEFEIASTKDLSIKVDSISVSDDDVEEELDRLRARFGTLKGVDRPAQKGDFVSIDMNASVDGEEIDSVSGVSYEVGSGSMMEGMGDALEGMSADEETDFDTTMRGGEHEGEAGKVHLKLRSVKVRELPEADDDFAQLASEFDTIGELRADLRKNVEKGKAGEQAVQARDKVLEHLRDNTEVPLPEDILKAELEARVKDSSTDEEKEEAKKAIEASLKDQLLLDKLVAQKNVQVSQQELLQFVFQTAQAYGVDPSQLLSGDNAQQQMSAMAGDMARNKALVAVLREVKVEDEDGNEVDLSEFTKDPAEEEAKATAEAAAAAAAEEAAEDEETEEEK
ncbi:MAG: trigger factor [Winkia neuii]|uniref:trigger factor n=1 Tax=Winkia neuii TaxID=33007 RepID=UPI00290261DF|nr:trigger factor [Winkia neuii]MDU3135030.1 trigger factor [Winkia neuii]